MWGGGGGLQHVIVSPRPLGFGFGTLGLRVWGEGLTIPGLSRLSLVLNCFPECEWVGSFFEHMRISNSVLTLSLSS